MTLEIVGDFSGNNRSRPETLFKTRLEFSCKFCENFKNTFIIEYLRTVPSFFTQLWVCISLVKHGTLPKVTLLHGYFSRFKNCANDTKSRKASQIVLQLWKTELFDILIPSPNKIAKKDNQLKTNDSITLKPLNRFQLSVSLWDHSKSTLLGKVRRGVFVAKKVISYLSSLEIFL